MERIIIKNFGGTDELELETTNVQHFHFLP